MPIVSCRPSLLWQGRMAWKCLAAWPDLAARCLGAVEIQEPDGEIFVRGNQEQQLFLVEFLRQFTDEWCGAIPKPPKEIDDDIDSMLCLQNPKERRLASITHEPGSMSKLLDEIRCFTE